MYDAFILLIGQSNMAGRGYREEAIPVDCENISTMRCLRWIKE